MSFLSKSSPNQTWEILENAENGEDSLAMALCQTCPKGFSLHQFLLLFLHVSTSFHVIPAKIQVDS